MKALTHWRHYLGWMKTPFTILTDHANLQYWKAPQKLNRQTARWHADHQGDDNNRDQTLLEPRLFIDATTIQIPDSSKRNLMTLIHDHPTAGHPGRDETIRKATEIL